MSPNSILERLNFEFKNLTEANFMEKFSLLAEDLINHYCIVKEGNEGVPKVTYHFMEIEFYYCSPKHPDVITYPRRAHAGDWFFHNSGVDICFASDVLLDDETGKVVKGQESFGFGGILIRALSKHVEGKETTYITGPLKCCYELFDKFSAFSNPVNFPKIVLKDGPSEDAVKPVFCGRYLHFSNSFKNKLDNILKESWEEGQNQIGLSTALDEGRFKYFLEKPYCFYDKKAFQDYKEDKSYKYYAANPLNTTKRLSPEE